MPVTFSKPRLIRLNGVALTDHNRQPLSVDVNRIESRQRMANGIMRKYFIADKKTFTTSWSDLPTLDTQTVDGFLGAAGIESFYLNNPTSTITLGVINRDATETNYTVMITSFNKTVVKRFGQWETWNVSLSLEEV